MTKTTSTNQRGQSLEYKLSDILIASKLLNTNFNYNLPVIILLHALVDSGALTRISRVAIFSRHYHTRVLQLIKIVDLRPEGLPNFCANLSNTTVVHAHNARPAKLNAPVSSGNSDPDSLSQERGSTFPQATLPGATVLAMVRSSEQQLPWNWRAGDWENEWYTALLARKTTRISLNA